MKLKLNSFIAKQKNKCKHFDYGTAEKASLYISEEFRGQLSYNFRRECWNISVAAEFNKDPFNFCISFSFVLVLKMNGCE